MQFFFFFSNGCKFVESHVNAFTVHRPWMWAVLLKVKNCKRIVFLFLLWLKAIFSHSVFYWSFPTDERDDRVITTADTKFNSWLTGEPHLWDTLFPIMSLSMCVQVYLWAEPLIANITMASGRIGYISVKVYSTQVNLLISVELREAYPPFISFFLLFNDRNEHIDWMHTVRRFIYAMYLTLNSTSQFPATDFEHIQHFVCVFF